MKMVGWLAAASVGMLACLSVGCSQPAQAKAKVMAPAKVARLMKQSKLEVAGVYRKGANYVVKAKGPSGNEVLVAVDGASGKILGLDVVKWAPGAKRVKRGSRGAAYSGDVYEFGQVAPVAALSTWVVYEPAQWVSTGPEWIEVETTPVSWTEVTYEENVTEVTYEEYAVEYAETYEVSLEEEAHAYEVAEETATEETVETVETAQTVETEETVEQGDTADTADHAADDGGDADGNPGDGGEADPG